MEIAEKDRRNYQVVAESLKDRIKTGEFSIGGRLPTERELAESYNLGRTVIHDALVMLEVQGFVEIRQGSGIYVTRKVYQQEALAAIAEAGKEALPPATPLELLRARQWLESHIARLAAINARDEDIERIADAYEMHQNAAFGEAKESMDFRFHMAIVRATQNPELVGVVKSLWQRRDKNPLWLKLHDRIRDVDYRNRWVLDHQKIVQALGRRDGDAAYVAMWNHIENVINFLTELQSETEGIGERPKLKKI